MSVGDRREFFDISRVLVIRMIPFREDPVHATDGLHIRIRTELERLVIINETSISAWFITHFVLISRPEPHQAFPAS